MGQIFPFLIAVSQIHSTGLASSTHQYRGTYRCLLVSWWKKPRQSVEEWEFKFEWKFLSFYESVTRCVCCGILFCLSRSPSMLPFKVSPMFSAPTDGNSSLSGPAVTVTNLSPITSPYTSLLQQTEYQNPYSEEPLISLGSLPLGDDYLMSLGEGEGISDLFDDLDHLPSLDDLLCNWRGPLGRLLWLTRSGNHRWASTNVQVCLIQESGKIRL